MASWKWNSFTGMADDSFLGRSGEFLDCNNIDIVDNSRYIDCAKSAPATITELGFSLSETIRQVKDGTYPAFCSANYTYIGGLNTSIADNGVSGAYIIEQIGTSSLPVTYFFKNGYIRQQSYNGATTPFNSPISTNVPTGIPTASCIGAGRIYFAVLNKLYVLNTIVDPTTTLSTVNATPANSNIPFGYTIKYMYIYNDVMNVVAVNGKDTVIYQLIESTTDVWVIRYYHTISGAVAIGACGDGNDLFWFTKNAIYQSNGTTSKKIKVVGSYEGATSFSTNAICTINEGIFIIADGTTVWNFGHKKPGYNNVLIRNTRALSVAAINGDIEVYFSTPHVYWERLSNFLYFTSSYITSLPYEAGNFNQPKENTALRIGHILPKASLYTSTSTVASITVGVLTDEMDQAGITAYTTVATITTPLTGVAPRFTDIMMQEIALALESAGYSSDFQYIKVKVTLTPGDVQNITSLGTFYKKTPKFFGCELVHNEIKKGIPQ